MSSSFRILTLSGFLLVTALGISSAHAAIFVSKPMDDHANQRCLTVFFGGNNSQAFTTPCTASFFQTWNWEGIEIRGLGTTNLALECLDIREGGTADGTIVQLFSCNGTGAQRWFYTASGQILNPPSGKCLDVNNVNSSFPSVVINTCRASAAHQKWQIN